MKVLFLCGPPLHSLMVVKETLKYCQCSPTILFSKRVMRGRSNLSMLWLIFKKSGFRYVFYKVIDSLSLKIGFNFPYDYERFEDVDSVLPRVKEIAPDVIVSLIFQKLPPELLKYKCINLHPGFLPDYRGHCGEIYPLLYDTHFGYTVHLIDEGLDTGDILEQEKFPIGKYNTAQNILHAQLMYGAQGLAEVLNNLDTIQPTPQGKGKFWPWISREEAKRVKLFRWRDLIGRFLEERVEMEILL